MREPFLPVVVGAGGDYGGDRRLGVDESASVGAELFDLPADQLEMTGESLGGTLPRIAGHDSTSGLVGGIQPPEMARVMPPSRMTIASSSSSHSCSGRSASRWRVWTRRCSALINRPDRRSR